MAHSLLAVVHIHAQVEALVHRWVHLLWLVECEQDGAPECWETAQHSHEEENAVQVRRLGMGTKLEVGIIPKYIARECCDIAQ